LAACHEAPHSSGKSFEARRRVASESLGLAVGSLDANDRTPDGRNGQITEIVGRPNSDPEVWDLLASKDRMDLSCGLFMAKSSEGLSLSPEALSALGTRHIELAICIDDPIDVPDDKAATEN